MRSNHNNLLNYFCDDKDLSKAYVRIRAEII